MKKLIASFLSTLLLLSITVFTGCEKSGDSEYGEIGISVISPVAGDSITVGDSIRVTSKLVGFTFEYSKVNFYFGTSTTPVGVVTQEMINTLSALQEKDAQFSFPVSTNGLSEGNVILTVEAVSKDLTKSVSVQVALVAKLPDSDDSSLDVVISSPVTATEFKIGDKVTVNLSLEGNLTLFEKVSAYLNNSTTAIYESDIENATKTFDIETESFAAGVYRLSVVLKLKTGETKTKFINFSLVEYIPTFTTVLGDAGYELKSLIQTYDNGYLAVSSYSTTGTRVIKYDSEGAVQWTSNIASSIGIAESVCEDTEYDKGYVLAGWRQNGSHKDTWVRKISMTDGSLIWNKTYGYSNVDDGATVIKKTIDDGYIVGGYSLNPYGTGPLIFSYNWSEEAQAFTDTVRTTWETGYDVRLLKLYSNGNEVWGNHLNYVSHKMWNDISLHKEKEYLWVRKMGDQYITDLTVKEDGNFYVTGWNNNRLYFEDGTAKKDMFFIEVDWFGGYVSTLTWSRMGAWDLTHPATEDDPYSGILNIQFIGANALGDYTEDEIGYGIVESQGGYGGQVIMAGETYQTDSKARLNDGWIVEFGINQDEDGALWEYSFGETSKNDKAYGIAQTKDGGYIITGYTTGTDKNTWLYKLDSKLSLLWSKNLGVSGDDTGVKVLQTTDGGFIVGGNVGAGASARAKLMKVNKTGDFSK